MPVTPPPVVSPNGHRATVEAPNLRLGATLRWCSFLAGGMVALVGGAVLLGWGLHIPLLISIRPLWVAMKPNTALALLLSGAALCMLSPAAPPTLVRGCGRALAGATALVGLLTAGEYLSGRSFRVDQLLFAEPSGAIGTSHPGRMAPTAALDLFLCGVALLLLDRVSPNGRRSAESLALSAALVALLGLVGYLYGVKALYGLTAYTQMAVHTSGALLMLAVGILCARPDRGWMAVLMSDSAGGHLLRRLLPAAVGLPLFLGWLRLAGQRAGLYLTESGVSFLVVASVVAFTVLVAWNARSLHRADLERRAAEQALRRAKEAAEAANRELETFSYSVSHDLRAPLRAIDGFSQALLEDCAEKLDSRGKDYLKRVRAAAQRMARLIDDLLELSYVARTDLRRGEVDLTGLARDIAAQLRRMQPDRDVEFAIQEGLAAIGDGPLMRVALENLIGNAWKFTGKKARARIEFGASMKNGEPIYFVRDDGAGFDMASTGKLFGPFQRLHSARDFEGTGIGLATVQRIIRRHEGRVWAEGAADRGATFYFTVPGRPRGEA
jgi:signal transduction histidine kinase